MKTFFNIYESDRAKRVELGKIREGQIADALRDQCGLDIRDATEFQDKHQKIDRWVHPENGPRIPLQIKFRQNGNDILFEVYDTFYGFGKRNKLGRDMIGDAVLYAVLEADGKTINLVETRGAKLLIWNMVKIAQVKGWNYENENSKTYEVQWGNVTAQLKLQHDPGDHRPKMVAFLPPEMLNAKKYTVQLRAA